MAGPAVPAPLAKFDVSDFGELKASPLAAGWQCGRALAGKLKHQRLLDPAAMAENVRTDFTVRAFVRTGDLLALKNGAMEYLESLTVFRAARLERYDAHFSTGRSGLPPHSVLTLNLRDDDPDGPTRRAEARVIAFFKQRTGA